MVNKDTVLQLTDNGLNVFRHYIQGQWRVGRNFLNPLYEDKRASCNVYYDRRTNTYRMKDFGNDEFSGDCFSLVAKLKGLNCKNPKDFVEVLQTINRDLNLGLDEEDTSFVVSVSPVIPKEAVIESKKNKPYSTVQKQFSPKEIAFWQQYGITDEILKAYKTVSLKEFRSENSEGKPFFFTSSEQEPIFGYLGKRHVKIYRPFSEIRFLYGGNFGENYCFGLEQLPAKGDTLFITGGEKDVLSLASSIVNFPISQSYSTSGMLE